MKLVFLDKIKPIIFLQIWCYQFFITPHAFFDYKAIARV